MKNMTLISQDKKETNISSEDVRNMIEGFESVQEVRDISETMEKDALGYDIKLNSEHIEEILENQMENLSYTLNDEDEAETILFEQAEYVSEALADNLKEFVENRYGVDNFNSDYDIYKASLNEGIGLTLTLSFGKVKHSNLYELASTVNKKNTDLK